MATKLIMPALGMAQETGKVLQWLRAEGESVTEGEPLIEVETDKVAISIEAPASGILTGLTAMAGDEVPVGQVIAMILTPGETSPERDARRRAAPATVTSEVPSSSIGVSRVKSEGGRIRNGDVPDLLKVKEAVAPTGHQLLQTPASPKARRLATERRMDIRTIKGTGPDGAVLAADVLAAEEASAHMAAHRRALILSTAERLVAERATQSWTGLPHLYLLREVNARGLIAWRESAQQRYQRRLSYTDLLIKLVAGTLRKHPRLNATSHDSTVVLSDEINIGLVVADHEGLIMPSIRRADELGLKEIAARRQHLMDRARLGKLQPEDIQGATFTVSNLGMYGVDIFKAIIDPPQVAVLAIGRIAQRVVTVDGQPAIQPTMILSLSCDHRVADGLQGARFLNDLAKIIEEPMGLLD